MDSTSLSHTKWKCQYHIVLIPKYRRELMFSPERVGWFSYNTIGVFSEALLQYTYIRDLEEGLLSIYLKTCTSVSIVGIMVLCRNTFVPE